MLKNLKVRTKLGIALAVPLLALIAVGAIGVRDRGTSTVDARNFGLGLAAAVLVSLLLASLMARSITKPLSRLTERANALAGEQLPALVERLRNPGADETPSEMFAVRVDSKDEIGQLARALDSIQGVTRTVADEQAALLRKGIGEIFVSLARRNQTLLDRQIEFIDQLEASEADPDQLENLFRLDHLATRMRRNAESLLVLAGAEPPRRRTRAVDMADVIRVAVGEVEHFARIQLLALDDATIPGGVAVDLAHLLAELMENASQFSPPDTRVEIVGQRNRDGDYVITVADQGIGMNAEQLADANHTIVSPPTMGLSISRSLGFTVIGRLAQRHGLGIRLTPSPGGGVVAAVYLPVMVTNPRSAPTAEAEPASRRATTDDLDLVIPAAPVPGAAADLAIFGDPARASANESTDISDLFAHDPTAVPPVTAPVRATGLLPPPPPAQLTPPAHLTPPATSPILEVPPPPPAPPTLLPPRPSRSPVSTPSLLSQSPVIARPEAPEADWATAGLESAPLDPFEGLTRRLARTDPAPPAPPPNVPIRSSQRSPEEVRQMLSRYRSGLKRGRHDDTTEADPK